MQRNLLIQKMRKEIVVNEWKWIRKMKSLMDLQRKKQ